MNITLWAMLGIAIFGLVYGYLVHKGKIKDEAPRLIIPFCYFGSSSFAFEKNVSRAALNMA